MKTVEWQINYTRKATKQIKSLPPTIKIVFLLLLDELKYRGPNPGTNWKNYGKLNGFGKDFRHCHLKKGKTTYVCCWEIIDKKIKIMEIYYVGTHEKAPY